MELKSLTEQKSLLATLPAGKRARLYRLLYEFGPGNGTLMLLPIDQGIEHGPRDFFANPASNSSIAGPLTASPRRKAAMTTFSSPGVERTP